MITYRGASFRKTIATERLLLRRQNLADSQAVFLRYASDPAVTRFLPWVAHQTLAQTKEYLSGALQDFRLGRRVPWVIETRPDGRLIGMIELRLEGHRAEVGYVLAHDSWGQGFATEALQAVIAEAMNMPFIYRVWAVCNVAHDASARVMSKVGMQREALLKSYSLHPNYSDNPSDVYLFTLIK